MKILVYTWLCAALLSPLIVHAEEDSRVSKLQATDEARVAAFKSGDAAALGSVLSDELRYAHSNGLVDSKTSLIELISTGKTKYLAGC